MIARTSSARRQPPMCAWSSQSGGSMGAWEAGSWKLEAGSQKSLTADEQPIPEVIPQIAVLVDQLLRLLDVVLDAAPLDALAVEDDVARARIAVARLADAADVDDRLARIDAPPVV